MRMYDMILKKRDGKTLSREEIDFFIRQYTDGRIPDYQVSALMMAIYFQGMTEEETLDLTQAMAHSGEILDLSAIAGKKSDKHSTGGVGDKTSLVLGPLVAAAGAPVAKMSGRGLGHTGGTIDKLESFPGFRTDLTADEFIRQVNRIGIAIMSPTADLAPADKKLYALRDVTGTVENMSLIASSIMSKKLAAGADCIVLDVKTGSGAFMKKEADSFALAEEMVRIGNNAGRYTCAVISDMDQPLGYAIGNALEVREAIDTLKGQGAEDLRELCLTLGARMLAGTGHAADEKEAYRKLLEMLESGAALQKLEEWVAAQGGDPEAVRNPDLLPAASLQAEVLSPVDGYLNHMEADEVGRACLILGGGRETKESTIDPAVGLVLKKKAGDFVRKGEVLAVIHANEPARLQEAKERFLAACFFSSEKPQKRPLIHGFVTAEGTWKLWEAEQQ